MFLLALSACSTHHVSRTSSKKSGKWKETSSLILLEEEYEARERGEISELDILSTRNQKVEQWLDYFQGRGRKWFHIWMERSGRYIPFMKKVLREHGLPEDLVYLAMIESGFSSRAYSRARAVGQWQFMKATGRKYGLRVNFWVDERRDPEKATVAAARHLKDLYDQFQNWKLAAAAYNAGAGKISRAIARYKTEDFWELTRYRYLRPETKNYVPKLIAAALIAKDPEKYGFTSINYAAPLAYDKIILKQPVNLEVLAEKANYNVKELMALNPELNHPVTPPDQNNYELRVPSGSSEQFLMAYNSLGPDEFFQYASHRVRRGDTISGIAHAYRVPQSEILRLNKIRSVRALQIGQVLILPIPKGVKTVAQYEKNERPAKPRKTKKQLPPQTEEKGAWRTYKVQSGDTLWALSKSFGVSVSQLKSVNALRRDHLYVGEEIKIPARADARSSERVVHVVRRGESLWSISRQYGIPLSQLKRENNLSRNTIWPGKKLVIPSI